MTAELTPTVYREQILENPEFARGKLDASHQAAVDYTTAMVVGGSIFVTLLGVVLDKGIAKAAGPYSGLISAGIGLVKSILGKPDAAVGTAKPIVKKSDDAPV